MSNIELYPLKLKSVLKDIVWGGHRLSDEFGKGEQNQKIAESWELAVHKNGVSVIENGKYAGVALSELYKNSKGKIVSENFSNENFSKEFPLLIKIIDANSKLSVQVHPDDTYARQNNEGYGKTEMWHIIDASENAQIVYGFNKDVTKEEIKSCLERENFESLLQYVNVKKGDTYFIPAGLVHAIGEGILIAEIQQNSDTTYRFYDYNRKDDKGNKRELHIEKALDVCITQKSVFNQNCQDKGIKKYDNYTVELLSSCEYFTVEKYEIMSFGQIEKNKPVKFKCDGTSFHYLLCINGSGSIMHNGEKYNVRKSDSYFIPANMGEYEFVNTEIDGKTEIIFSKI